MTQGLKRCNGCRLDLPATAFYTYGAKLVTPCKECKRRQYQANPEKVNARSKAWAAASPERMRELQAKRYEKNRERIIAAAMRWRLENPQRYKDIQRRSAAARKAGDPESYKEQLRRSAAARKARDPERYKEQARKRAAKVVADLPDRYIAYLLRRKAEELDPELLELKREHLLLRRLARQLKKAIDESITDKD